MAVKTQLSPTATPGRRYSFVAKSVATVWQQATFTGINPLTGELVVLVGKLKLSD